MIMSFLINSYSTGNIELKLHDWSVDFACWCTYKVILVAQFMHNISYCFQSYFFHCLLKGKTVAAW